MKFTTSVELPKQKLQLTPHSHILTLGSCFADHMGNYLFESLPEGLVCTNPHGTLYNPISIRNTLVHLLSDSIEFSINPSGFFKDAESKQWRHWDYSTAFVASTRKKLELKLQENWQKSFEVIKHLDVLFITFSTNHAYRIEQGPYAKHYAANCHKQPATLFTDQNFTSEELLSCWESLLQELYTKRPELKVVFTVSPYRYAKYGLHENALGKAHLLLLTEQLCSRYPNAIYFPAYEIVIDELRDYRFYAPDMLHPSEQAVCYIWERFAQWAFTPELHECAKERQAIMKAYQHRPTNPKSKDHQMFLKRLKEKEEFFQQKWTI